MPAHDTLNRVKNVIRTGLKLDGRVVLSDDMALAGGEYDLDSLDILLIVTGLEKEFGITINDAAMSKSAFESVASLAVFVDSCAATRETAGTTAQAKP
ncbi:MAG: acyl carrier protein [Phycisphaerales bacterium]